MVRPLFPRPARILALTLACALAGAACAADDASDPTLSPSATAGDSPPSTPAGSSEGPDSPVTGGAPTGTDATAPAAEVPPIDQVPLALTPLVTVNQPTSIAIHPDSDTLWIAERPGRVRQVDRTLDEGRGVERVTLRTQPVLDLSDEVGTEGEGGLLGITFAPDGTTLYVHYTDRGGDTVVAGYPSTLGPDGLDVDDSAARVLLTVDQPYANHNGGDLHFGPDGMLYITLGDGGGGGDPEETGQDPTDLLGSILRIDPRPGGDAPYAIPADNPFADGAGGAPEVWLWGARNPWRISFDPATGDLWVADVGQNAVEEINHLPAASGAGRGANLGWNLMEGDESYAGDPPPDHVGPIATYTHQGGRCSVTGGHVYRGSAVPALDGVYIFGDYCSGELFGLQGAGTGSSQIATLAVDRSAGAVIGFGQDAAGEIYVLQLEGQVSRLSPVDGGTPVEVVGDAG